MPDQCVRHACLRRAKLAATAPLRRLAWRERLKIFAWETWLSGLLRLQRGLELLGALAAALLLTPVLLETGLAILLTLGWPVLTAEVVQGRQRRPFRRYRFRCINDALSVFDRPRSGAAVAVGPHRGWHTRLQLAVSRFVRATGMEALPEVFNLLAGDMALFGPGTGTGPDEADERRPGLFRWPHRPLPRKAPTPAPPLWSEYTDARGFWNALRLLGQLVPAVFLGWGGYANAESATPAPAMTLWTRFDDLLRRVLCWPLALALALLQLLPFTVLYPLVRLLRQGRFEAAVVAGRNWLPVKVLLFRPPPTPGLMTKLFQALALDRFPLLGEVFTGPLWLCGQQPWAAAENQPLLPLLPAYYPAVIYRERVTAQDPDPPASRSAVGDLGILGQFLLRRTLNFLAGVPVATVECVAKTAEPR